MTLQETVSPEKPRKGDLGHEKMDETVGMDAGLCIVALYLSLVLYGL